MEKLELLKKVRRMDAPEFMLTRIQAKIRADKADRLPVSWQWAGAMACGLLLVFHIFLLETERTPPISAAEQVAESLQIQSSNQLYDE